MTASSVLTTSSFASLWHDSRIRRFIHEVAANRGGTIEDREDAEGEAWARLSRLPAGLGMQEYRREARRGIFSEYRRRYNQEKMEICTGYDDSREFGHGRMKGKYAGMRQLSTSCRGLHGTLCTAILTFEVACAMEQDNPLWLASDEYESLRQAAAAEEKDGIKEGDRD